MNKPKDRSAYKRAYRAANLERERAYGREYIRKNKEKRAAYRKLYRIKKAALISSTQKRWRAANPDALDRYSKKRREASAGRPRKQRAKLPAEVAKERLMESYERYRLRNREKLRIDTAARRAADPGKARAQWLADAARRKARKMGGDIGSLKLIVEWEQKWRKKPKAICYWCGKASPSKKCHSDHINPLKKGGSHAVENLCISCQPCNSHKSAKTLEAWNRQIAQPVLF